MLSELTLLKTTVLNVKMGSSIVGLYSVLLVVTESNSALHVTTSC